jgi:hypothetical protein
MESKIKYMQLFSENRKSTSSAFEISHPSSPPPPNPIFEMVEAMKMDDFWAELDNKGSGSSDNASTTFDPSTQCFDGILGLSDDKMNA